MKKLIEHINIIDSLDMQIQALLELMMIQDEDCCGTSATKVAAEMCLDMQIKLMAEVYKIKEEMGAVDGKDKK